MPVYSSACHTFAIPLPAFIHVAVHGAPAVRLPSDWFLPCCHPFYVCYILTSFPDQPAPLQFVVVRSFPTIHQFWIRFGGWWWVQPTGSSLRRTPWLPLLPYGALLLSFATTVWFVPRFYWSHGLFYCRASPLPATFTPHHTTCGLVWLMHGYALYLLHAFVRSSFWLLRFLHSSPHLIHRDFAATTAHYHVRFFTAILQPLPLLFSRLKEGRRAWLLHSGFCAILLVRTAPPAAFCTHAWFSLYCGITCVAAATSHFTSPFGSAHHYARLLLLYPQPCPLHPFFHHYYHLPGFTGFRLETNSACLHSRRTLPPARYLRVQTCCWFLVLCVAFGSVLPPFYRTCACAFATPSCTPARVTSAPPWFLQTRSFTSFLRLWFFLPCCVRTAPYLAVPRAFFYLLLRTTAVHSLPTGSWLVRDTLRFLGDDTKTPVVALPGLYHFMPFAFCHLPLPLPVLYVGSIPFWLPFITTYQFAQFPAALLRIAVYLLRAVVYSAILPLHTFTIHLGYTRFTTTTYNTTWLRLPLPPRDTPTLVHTFFGLSAISPTTHLHTTAVLPHLLHFTTPRICHYTYHHHYVLLFWFYYHHTTFPAHTFSTIVYRLFTFVRSGLLLLLHCAFVLYTVQLVHM